LQLLATLCRTAGGRSPAPNSSSNYISINNAAGPGGAGVAGVAATATAAGATTSAVNGNHPATLLTSSRRALLKPSKRPWRHLLVGMATLLHSRHLPTQGLPGPPGPPGLPQDQVRGPAEQKKTSTR